MQCRSLDEVRTNIDHIDRQIVALLAERSGYVRQAAGFKQSMADVQAPRRVEQVVTRVRDVALERGVDPDLVEQVYRTMIARFIEIEALELDRH